MIDSGATSIKTPLNPLEGVSLLNSLKVKRVLKVALRSLKKGVGVVPLNQDNANNVYTIRNLRKVIGYLKFGGKGNEGSSILESVAWRISIIIGCSEYFTPTIPLVFDEPKLISFKFPKGTKGARGERVIGSLQPKQIGLEMGDYLNKREHKAEISWEDLMSVTVVALAFGMWDWHDGNGVINKRGKPKYFDNARFLPNENGLMYIQGMILPSFKFTLISLQKFNQLFLTSDCNFMRKEALCFLKKLPEVRQYLKNETFLNELPKGWIEREKAVNAMEARVKKILSALDDINVSTLNALVCEVIPYFKFFAVLSLLVLDFEDVEVQMSLEDTLSELMRRVGHYNLHDLLALCCHYGINPQLILDESLDGKITFRSLVSKMISRIEQFYEREVSQEEENVAKWNAIQIIKKLKKEAYVELKDLGECDISKSLHKKVVLEAKTYGVSCENGDIEASNIAPTQAVMSKVNKERESRYRLYFWCLDGKASTKDIVFYHPYDFEVVGEEMSPPKSFAGVLGSIYPDYYFPRCHSQSKALKYLCHDDEWLLGREKGSKDYCVYYSDEGKVEKYRYVYSKIYPGKLVGEKGEICTLNQIEKGWSEDFIKVVRKDDTSLAFFN